MTIENNFMESGETVLRDDLMNIRSAVQKENDWEWTGNPIVRSRGTSTVSEAFRWKMMVRVERVVNLGVVL